MRHCDDGPYYLRCPNRRSFGYGGAVGLMAVQKQLKHTKSHSVLNTRTYLLRSSVFFFWLLPHEAIFKAFMSLSYKMKISSMKK